MSVPTSNDIVAGLYVRWCHTNMLVLNQASHCKVDAKLADCNITKIPQTSAMPLPSADVCASMPILHVCILGGSHRLATQETAETRYIHIYIYSFDRLVRQAGITWTQALSGWHLDIACLSAETFKRSHSNHSSCRKFLRRIHDHKLR